MTLFAKGFGYNENRFADSSIESIDTPRISNGCCTSAEADPPVPFAEIYITCPMV